MAFIAMPSASKENIQRIYDLCQSAKLETKIMKEQDNLLADDLNENKKYPVEDISIGRSFRQRRNSFGSI